jgi:hypothetical protein
VCLAVLFGLAVNAAHGADRAPRHRLHQQQLQQALDLQLQQSLAPSRSLSVRDRIELDRLQARQRMEQRMLHDEHLVQSQRFAHDAERLRTIDQLYRQEGESQRQRFYLDQQRVLGAMRAPPLQSKPQPGELDLP